MGAQYERLIQNKEYLIANMLFDINDVVETLESHSINDDIIKEYDHSQFDMSGPFVQHQRH